MSDLKIELVPLEPAHLLALMESEAAYEKVTGLRVAAGLQDFFEQVPSSYLEDVKSASGPDVWRFGFVVMIPAENYWAGCASYKGPPDAHGMVEIAYAIAPSWEGHGLATQAAAFLTEQAFRDARVKIIRAHTLPEKNASGRVLEKCGFTFVGEAMEPEDRLVWRWEYPRR
ncbi:acetyltransferase (GNAT) family protein [Roseimicrobium gellanilyticum]|uniref:Acetyltransferase (GNAT) family protein n=1 Tax=Roseimicrobium gellanilyticum TaxID=748857 RepID=A0A366HEC2_9BACT|nr:GNAT family N-acetyltransferase [Roseimicrobium gellanilyticum]RBP39658.1 acetyltransferase (GNAT) family protein [Roseimicrobium gellanilyticum]